MCIFLARGVCACLVVFVFCSWLGIYLAKTDVALNEISQLNVASAGRLTRTLFSHSHTLSLSATVTLAMPCCTCHTLRMRNKCNKKHLPTHFQIQKLAMQLSISICITLSLSLLLPPSLSCMLHELQLGKLSQIAFPARQPNIFPSIVCLDLPA